MSGPYYPPSNYAPAPPSNAPNYRWWVPGEGIRRDVIQADVQRYLGPDALVKPGVDQYGRPGYWVAAVRTFTPSMLDDLRSDSANFERLGSRGTYQDSTIHQSRHYWGPTSTGGASAASSSGSAPAPVQSPYSQHTDHPNRRNDQSPENYRQTARPQVQPQGGSTYNQQPQYAQGYGSTQTANQSTPAIAQSPNYTHGRTHGSSAYETYAVPNTTPGGYDQNQVPRDLQQQPPVGGQYSNTTQRYFGFFRPEFLVHH
jgi:hypothetical protein